MATPAADRLVADRYALKASIGRGGMGVVWRARDTVLGREVAVKEVVFPPTMPEEERRPAQARVMREARAAARLNHPAAVILYDVVQDHGMAKLADFGIASLQGDPQLTSTGLVIGSPAYMAPEQAKGEGSGPPADFWALGGTIFYAVEGEPPFDRGTSIATLAAVVNDPPREPRRAGPLTDLITALLAKDPGSRPSGPKVRAWLHWLLVVAPSSPIRVEASRRPTRAGAQTSPPSIFERAGTPAPDPTTAGVGPSRWSEKVSAFEPDQAPAPAPPAEPTPVQRPSRPLLPPAPPVPRRAGRRSFAIVALLLVGGVLTAWLTDAFRSNPPGDRAAPATTRASTPVEPARGRAVSAATRGDGGGTGTTRSAPSTTKRPATTKAPATSTTVVLRGRVPAGWRAFTNQAGRNRVGIPPGFRARTRQSYNATVVEEQSGAQRVFTVRSQTPSAQLPQASRDYRAWARRNFAGFREVSYAESQTYAGHEGAVVFEYVAVRDGRRVHVSHINVKGRTWGYNVEFIAPADQWDASQSLARQFEQAFQPLG